MRGIHITKVVINIGSGDDKNRQENAKRLLETISAAKPTDAISKRRLPEFKIAKGQKIGTFVTLRGEAATKVLNRLLDAVDHKVQEQSVTENSLSFGIKEYIDINGIKYDPKIGMMGMNVNVSFKRKGARVEQRKIKRASVPKGHKIISREELKGYLKDVLKVSTIERS
jgi:large subunit ribosomal protein L5